MIKVTVHEKRRVNEEEPTPASSPSRKSRQRGAQTTPTHLHWCGTNPPSSWLAQSVSPWSRCYEIGSHFYHFPTVFINKSNLHFTVHQCHICALYINVQYMNVYHTICMHNISIHVYHTTYISHTFMSYCICVTYMYHTTYMYVS